MKITSASNERFKTWSSLLFSKGIKEHQQFLLSGSKIIHEFLKKPHLEIIAELRTEKLLSLFQLSCPIPQSTNFISYELSSDLFHQLDELGTGFNILILKTPVIQNANLSNNPDGLEILCPLSDPSNVGALLRSAEAFGASKVILCQESANPFLPKAIKTSSGSGLRMDLYKGPSIKNLDCNFVVLDANGTSLKKFSWQKNCRLLIGEEGTGIQNVSIIDKSKVNIISIPTEGVESLNATVAASIAMYDYALKTRYE